MSYVCKTMWVLLYNYCSYTMHVLALYIYKVKTVGKKLKYGWGWGGI
jgi:hypothetical protein